MKLFNWTKSFLVGARFLEMKKLILLVTCAFSGLIYNQNDPEAVGGLQSYVSDFLPEWMPFKQAKEVDGFDFDDYVQDFEESMYNEDQSTTKTEVFEYADQDEFFEDDKHIEDDYFDHYYNPDQENYVETKEENVQDEKHFDLDENTDQETELEEPKEEQVEDYTDLFPGNFDEILEDAQASQDEKIEENLDEEENFDEQENFEEEELFEEEEEEEQELSLDDKIKNYLNPTSEEEDENPSSFEVFCRDLDYFLEEKMEQVYSDVGEVIDVVSDGLGYYAEQLAHVLGPVDLELVKLGFIVFIHAVYIFKASKFV